MGRKPAIYRDELVKSRLSVQGETAENSHRRHRSVQNLFSETEADFGVDIVFK